MKVQVKGRFRERRNRPLDRLRAPRGQSSYATAAVHGRTVQDGLRVEAARSDCGPPQASRVSAISEVTVWHMTRGQAEAVTVHEYRL
jgi:hypothetical protein